MRFESRHRQLKAAAVSISSTLNLLVSIAVKQTLQMFHMIHSFIFKTNSNVRIKVENNIEFYDRIELSGSIYTPGTVVVTNNMGLQIYFGEITKMYKKMTM